MLGRVNIPVSDGLYLGMGGVKPEKMCQIVPKTPIPPVEQISRIHWVLLEYDLGRQ